jgi:mRNA-degrading endonuclease RelE of RelBE toxin-antitoxin system
MKWDVHFSHRAKSQYEKLKKNGKRPPINDIIDFFVLELKSQGPERTNWSNYSKLDKNSYHCHLKKGKPTYVICWTVLEHKFKQIEIYYVGTHENAPY